MFFQKYPVIFSSYLTCDVFFGDLEFLLLFDCKNQLSKNFINIAQIYQDKRG